MSGCQVLLTARGEGPLENLRQTAKVLVLGEFISHQLNSRLQYNRFEIVQTTPLCERRFLCTNKQGGRDRSRPFRLTLRTSAKISAFSQFIHLIRALTQTAQS